MAKSSLGASSHSSASVAAKKRYQQEQAELEELDELNDLASTDDEEEDDGTGKKRKVSDGRPKTQAQIDRRRERNRILARRTRLRKKFFFESLQKQVSELQRENHVLKDIVKVKMGDVAPGILSKCNTDLTPIVTESQSKATELLAQSDFKLMAMLQAAQRSFVITDPYVVDNPIVFASAAFLETTGYTMDQVLGRNCRFLQGPKTDRCKVDTIRQGIAEGIDTSVCLLNYRADGSTFWNQFFVAALRDGNKRIVNYVGVQCPVKKPPPDDIEYAAFIKSQSAPLS
jgi:PAS domain S-box-containing protein